MKSFFLLLNKIEIYLVALVNHRHTPIMENATKKIERPDDAKLKDVSKEIAIALLDAVLKEADRYSIRKYINTEKVCLDTFKDIYEYLYSLHAFIIKDVDGFRQEYQQYGRSMLSLNFYNEHRDGPLSHYLWDCTVGERIREDFMDRSLEKCMNIYIELAGGRHEDDADCNRWDNLHIIVADCILDKLEQLYVFEVEVN